MRVFGLEAGLDQFTNPLLKGPADGFDGLASGWRTLNMVESGQSSTPQPQADFERRQHGQPLERAAAGGRKQLAPAPVAIQQHPEVMPPGKRSPAQQHRLDQRARDVRHVSGRLQLGGDALDLGLIANDFFFDLP